MADRIPAGASEFIPVKSFREIFQKLSDREEITNTVILTGTSGVGKTELALQVVKQFTNELQQHQFHDIFEWKFNCDLTGNLITELARCASVKGLEIPSLRNGHDNLDINFQEFYAQVNQRFPNHLKCLVFDDAEMQTDVIRRIDNYICNPLFAETDELIRRSWKVVVTTQDANDKWFDGCDQLDTDDMVKINGFEHSEVLDFFHHSDNKRLRQEQIEKIIQEIGNLPMILKVVRFEIRSNQLCGTDEFLTMYLNKISTVDRFCQPSINNDTRRALNTLHVSLTRLVEQSNQVDQYREMMKMLTLFDEKNITNKLLISCAEVILNRTRDAQDQAYAAYDLANGFAYEMVKRSLCEKTRTVGDTRLISLHKLVQQSMHLFRKDDDEAAELQLRRKVLLALTRVMPKDGRGHESHLIFGYMYSHGRALVSEVEKMRDKIDRTSTPCIMLMLSDLQTAMGYCQLALRGPARNAVQHFEESLKLYSTLMAGTAYEQLGNGDANRSADEMRAQALFDGSRNSPLAGSQFYLELVSNVPRYHQVSERDLSNMAERKIDKPADCLFNGHLRDSSLMDLERNHNVLASPTLATIYPVELLVELYAMYSRIPSFDGNCTHEDVQKSIDCAKAALLLCGLIKQDRVVLMTEIITTRELLKLRINRCRSVNELEEIEQRWYELKLTDANAYEYGLMRADFSKDEYHKFLCDEAVLDCKGRRFEYPLDDPEKTRLVVEGQELFSQLIQQTKTCKGTHNPQTTSKCYKNCAVFLWHGGRKTEAIKAVIDAMRYLNIFLRCKDTSSDFPEQQESCGKFKPLLKLINEYWNDYDPQRDGLVLLADGTDADRLNYMTKFIECWQNQGDSVQAGGSNRFSVMEEILDLAGIDSVDDVMSEGPVSATYN